MLNIHVIPHAADIPTGVLAGPESTESPRSPGVKNAVIGHRKGKGTSSGRPRGRPRKEVDAEGNVTLRDPRPLSPYSAARAAWIYRRGYKGIKGPSLPPPKWEDFHRPESSARLRAKAMEESVSRNPEESVSGGERLK